MINPETGQALIDFPCDFLFKITGKNEDNFEENMIALLQKVDPNLERNRIKHALSSTQKYLSLSVFIHVTNQQEVDEVYRLLKSEPKVLWAI